MPTVDPAGTDWTVHEIDLIVADYFDMLHLELAGKPFVKSQRNAALQEMTGRSKGSIEFKHQNISAVLQKLGMPWIIGYKPMSNFQRALIDGIERYLDLAAEALPVTSSNQLSEFAESKDLYIEQPPSPQPHPEKENSFVARLVRKFDPAERDARNRDLGMRGERLVFNSERNRLERAGRLDLAKKVRWVSAEDGDGAGFDIHSFDPSGQERLLEVKTTVGSQTTPFYLTENERSLSIERPNEFRIFRLYDFAREPRAFEIEPPLDQGCSTLSTDGHCQY